MRTLLSSSLMAGLLALSLSTPAQALDPQAMQMGMGIIGGMMRMMQQAQRGQGGYGNPSYGGYGSPHYNMQPYTFATEDGGTCTVTYRRHGRGVIKATRCLRPTYAAAPAYGYGDGYDWDDDNLPPGSYLAPDADDDYSPQQSQFHHHLSSYR